MTLIIIELIVFGWVVVAFSWYKLDTFDSKFKIMYIVFGIVICYFITFLLCNLATIGVEFELKEIKNAIVQNLVLVFTPINAVILMPYIGGTLSMYDSNQIEKDEALSRIKRMIIIFLVMAILEFVFLRSIENGIIQYMDNLKLQK